LLLFIASLLLPLVGFTTNESMFSCQAQQKEPDWQPYFQLIAEDAENSSTDEEDNNLELLYETLTEAASSPININAITEEDLQNLLCFSQDQIDAILGYVRKYAPIRTKAELLMIPYLDEARRGLLSSLTYLGEAPPKENSLLDSLKYDYAVSNYREQFHPQQTKGDATFYARVPSYKNWLRINYVANRHIKVGAVAAQDADEPFFKSPNNLGYDYYSGNIQLQKYGLLKKLVLGRYRMKSGLGLILNNNFSFGKMLSLSSLQSTATSIHPHSSRSENYLQGAAATLALSKHLDMTVFGSYRKIDATLTKDSLGIATILHSGYHRTASEINRKHNASQTSAGVIICFTEQRYHLGTTALINHYDRPLVPYTDSSSTSQLYRKYYAYGQDFWNISIDYGYKLGKKFRFEGETATGDCGQIATINTLSWLPNKKLSLSAIQRYYPYRFYSTMGSSFSEGGTNQDESGLYLSATWNPTTRISLIAYSDIAYFAWPKYQASASSRSFDNLLQVTFLTSQHSSITARYRMHCRQKNGEQEGELIYKDDQRLRVTYRLQSGRLSLKSQVDLTYCKYKDVGYGGMLSTSATYSLKRIKLCGGVGYFRTDNYNTRVYAYEQSTPYNLSFPSFYGRGVRVYALSQVEVFKKFSLIAKCGYTSSTKKTDLEVMARYRF